MVAKREKLTPDGTAQLLQALGAYIADREGKIEVPFADLTKRFNTHVEVINGMVFFNSLGAAQEKPN